MADKYVIGLFQGLESEIIGDIARRIKKTGRFTETAEIMAKSMMEKGYSPARIRAEVMKSIRADKDLQDEIAKNTLEYKKFVKEAIRDTIKEAKKAGDKMTAEGGMMAFNEDLSLWEKAGQDLKKPNSLSQLINSFKAQTAGSLRNITRTTGFKDTVLYSVASAYQREVDQALVKVATGAFSYDQAVNDCVHRLAQSGLRSVDYASGRSYQLDTAARMSVRTSMSQLSGRITEENIRSTGVDLVITSQHMGSRPEHAVWQNKVFSYSGKSKKYPDFFKETGYGTVTGLKGANCSHDFFPFWEGISVKDPDIKEPDPVVVNGKSYTYYQATQKQRLMERQIRATKREIEAQKAIGGDITELYGSLKKQTADYHAFSTAVGIRAKDNRLRVVGGSSGVKKNKTLVVPNSQKKADQQKISAQKGQMELLKKYGSLTNIMLSGTVDDMAEWDRYQKITGKTEKELLSELSKNANNWESILGMQSDNTMKPFIDQLLGIATDDELSALKLWSGETYANINRYMRYGINVDDISKNAAKSIENVLNRISTTEDIIVHRGTGTKHIFEKIAGDWKNDPSILMGQEFKDDGFVATSPLEKGGFSGAGASQAELFIKVPKGTHGAYIAQLAHNELEKEFLLQRGYSYRIIKAEYRSNPLFPEDKDLKVWCEVILDE